MAKKVSPAAVSLTERHNMASADLDSALSAFEEIARALDEAQESAHIVAAEAQRRIDNAAALLTESNANAEQAATAARKIRSLLG